MKNFKELLPNIKAFVFDIDGVLSANVLATDPDGIPVRTANVKDGYALQWAVKCGFPIAIISGAKPPLLRNRYQNLGINDIYLGAENKTIEFHHFLESHHLQASEVIYMGDDIPDLPVLQEAGVPVCPLDAAEEVKEICYYISHLRGGEGCVRDIIEQVLKAQAKWMHHKEAYGW